MGRRSFGISATQISRMISAANAAQKAREREELINSQIGIATKQKPTYSICAFDFNQDSRVSHVSFLETTKYRKIERYVTQNGVRHPIYGDWCSKTKTIKKTLKLTNEALENLNKDPDGLVRGFSYQIVSKIDNQDFYPSWFIVETLENEMKLEISECKRFYANLISPLVTGNTNSQNKIKESEIIIKDHNGHIEKTNKKLNKVIRKIAKAKNKNHFVVFSILTFGIFAIVHSEKRISRLCKKQSFLEETINNHNAKIKIEVNKIGKCNESIKDNKEKISNYEKTRYEKIAVIQHKYSDEIDQVDKLPTNMTTSLESDFIPLKKFAGMTYEKIVGCYVIKNVEKNKYYVGQSKDVFKRITRDHFNGTKVKNIIFAEDYFSSTFDNKDNLFEVKVIRCETKDELDRTERELIEVFDSFNNGYNATSGNS